MARIRSALIMAGLSVAILLPCASAFARGRGGGRGGGGGGGMFGGGGGGPPPVDPRITADRQNIAGDHTTLDTATAAYNQAVKDFSDDFKKQDDYVAAKKALQAAEAERDAAKAAVIKKLSTDNSDYKTAVAKLAVGKKNLDALHASNAPRETIGDQAEANFKNDTAIGKMEDDAAAADPTCSAAQKKVDDAAAVLAALDAKLADSIKTDDKVKPLKDAVDSAKARLTADSKKLMTDQAN